MLDHAGPRNDYGCDDLVCSFYHLVDDLESHGTHGANPCHDHGTLQSLGTGHDGRTGMCVVGVSDYGFDHASNAGTALCAL